MVKEHELAMIPCGRGKEIVFKNQAVIRFDVSPFHRPCISEDVEAVIVFPQNRLDDAGITAWKALADYPRLMTLKNFTRALQNQMFKALDINFDEINALETIIDDILVKASARHVFNPPCEVVRAVHIQASA